MEREAKNNNTSFEEALRRLEEIVAELEDGDIPLEESLKLYEEGIGLYRLCMAKLNELQGKIEILVKEMDGTFIRKDFTLEDVGED